jgi:hypothetical protein
MDIGGRQAAASPPREKEQREEASVDVASPAGAAVAGVVASPVPVPPESGANGGAGFSPGVYVKEEFKVVAICGSSLLTTHGDIRPVAARKSMVVIEGVKYRIAERGEYSALRIQLSSDYSGATNLEATLQIMGKHKGGGGVDAGTGATQAESGSGSGSSGSRRRMLKDDVDHGVANEVASAVGKDLDDLMVSLRPQAQTRGKKRESTSAENKRRAAPNPAQSSGGSGSAAGGGGGGYSAAPAAVNFVDGRQHRIASDPNLNVPVGVVVQPRRRSVKAAAPEAPRGRVVGFGRAEGKPVGEAAAPSRSRPHNVCDGQTEQRRLDAMERVKVKKLKDAVELRRRQEVEDLVVMEKKEAMQRKAEDLRSATEERVMRKKMEKRSLEMQARRREEEEEKQKEQRRKATQSDEAQNRIKKLNQETKERMKKRQLMEQKRQMDEDREKEEALRAFSEKRGRNVPVASHNARAAADSDGRSVHSARSRRSRSPRSRPGSEASRRQYESPSIQDVSPPAPAIQPGAPPPLPVEAKVLFNSPPLPAGRAGGGGNNDDDDGDDDDYGMGVGYGNEYNEYMRDNNRENPVVPKCTSRVVDENDHPRYDEDMGGVGGGGYHGGDVDEDFGEVSEDSIGDDRLSALPDFPRHEPDIDVISTTSSLTNDDSYAYSSVKGSGYSGMLAAKQQHHQQQLKGQKKVPIWKKLQPIPVKAYKPIPK